MAPCRSANDASSNLATSSSVVIGLSIQDIHYTAFFVERENRIRASFRSMGPVDVNKFARKYYNGGGHHNAAGAFFNGTIEEALKHFEQAARETFQNDFKI